MKRWQRYSTWPVVILITVISLLAIGNGIMTWYARSTRQVVTDYNAVQTGLQLKPIITTLPLAKLPIDQLTTLRYPAYTDYIQQAHGTTDTFPAPSLPAQSAVTDTKLGTSVVISWQNAAAQTYDGVEVYRDDQLIATVPELAGRYFDNSVTINQTYYYRLQTFRMIAGDKVVSVASEPFTVIPSDTTAPLAPTAVQVTRSANDPAKLLISWANVSITDHVANRIYRSDQPGVLGSVVQTVDAALTSWLDTTTQSNQTYYYSVTAVDAADNESSTVFTVAPTGNSSPFVSNQVQVVQQLSNDKQ